MASKKNGTPKRDDARATAAEKRAAFLATYRTDIRPPKPPSSPPDFILAAELRARELRGLCDAALAAFESGSPSCQELAEAVDRAYFGYLGGDKTREAIMLLTHSIATCAELGHGSGPIRHMVATRFPELSARLDSSKTDEAVAAWEAARSDKWARIVSLARAAKLTPPAAASLAQYYSRMRRGLKKAGWFE